MSPKADKIVPYFGDLFLDEPLPKDGYISLDPKKPGFGMTLNRALDLRRPFSRSSEELGTLKKRAAFASETPEQQEWLGRAAKIQKTGKE